MKICRDAKVIRKSMSILPRRERHLSVREADRISSENSSDQEKPSTLNGDIQKELAVNMHKTPERSSGVSTMQRKVTKCCKYATDVIRGHIL